MTLRNISKSLMRSITWGSTGMPLDTSSSTSNQISQLAIAGNQYGLANGLGEWHLLAKWTDAEVFYWVKWTHQGFFLIGPDQTDLHRLAIQQTCTNFGALKLKIWTKNYCGFLYKQWHEKFVLSLCKETFKLINLSHLTTQWVPLSDRREN